MKRIKLFEDFTQNDYYKSYQPEDTGYDYIDDLKVVPLSKKVSDYLKELGFKISEFDVDMDIYAPSELQAHKKKDGIEVTVWELEDDYFNVEITDWSGYGKSGEIGRNNPVALVPNTTYYKCDQIEGLKKLLKDKGY